MYRDYKKSESLDTGFVGGSGIIWMFSGIILGLLVGLGMYYFTSNNSTLSMASKVNNKIRQAQSTNPSTTSKTRVRYSNQINSQSRNSQTKGLGQDHQRKTKFSYYAVLPTLDVPVGADKPIDTSRQVSANTQEKLNTVRIKSNKKEKQKVAQLDVDTQEQEVKPRTPVAKHGNYLLQVASYKQKSRAKQTRGRLTRNGIDAYIKSKKIKGRMWYRVVAGPVDQNSIGTWKHTAEKMGHRPLVISLR